MRFSLHIVKCLSYRDILTKIIDTYFSNLHPYNDRIFLDVWHTNILQSFVCQGRSCIQVKWLKVKYWIYTFHAALSVSKHITEKHFVLCNNFMLVWYITKIDFFCQYLMLHGVNILQHTAVLHLQYM